MAKPKVTRAVRRTYTDLTTGEQHTLEHDEPVVKKIPARQRSKDPFVMIFSDQFKEIFNKDLTLYDMRVLLGLIAVLPFDGGFIVGPTELGKEIGMHRSNVANSYTRLINQGIIHNEGRGKNRMNPTYFWKGNVHGRDGVISEKKNRVAFAPKEDQ